MSGNVKSAPTTSMLLTFPAQQAGPRYSANGPLGGLASPVLLVRHDDPPTHVWPTEPDIQLHREVG